MAVNQVLEFSDQNQHRWIKGEQAQYRLSHYFQVLHSTHNGVFFSSVLKILIFTAYLCPPDCPHWCICHSQPGMSGSTSSHLAGEPLHSFRSKRQQPRPCRHCSPTTTERSFNAGLLLQEKDGKLLKWMWPRCADRVSPENSKTIQLSWCAYHNNWAKRFKWILVNWMR